MAGVAGWTGESVHWEGIYKRGLTGEVLDRDLPLYQTGEMVMLWSHVPRMPTQTQRYLEEQAASLRPSTFARLWRNEWVASESVFIVPSLWDGCVDVEHCPMVADKRVNIFVGVDVGIKHDTSAVVAVTRHDDRLYLARHQIWTPTPEQPIDLEATIEQEIYRLAHEFHLVTVLVDPYQMHRSMASLKRSGLDVREYPQTAPRLTVMGQVLLDALKAKALVLYADPVLRQQALATTSIESIRGFRIAKERASKKIDAIIALAMACVGATEGDIPYRPSEAEDREQQYQEAKLWHRLGFQVDAVPYGGVSNIVHDDELYRPPDDQSGWGLGPMGYSDGDFGPYDSH